MHERVDGIWEYWNSLVDSSTWLNPGIEHKRHKIEDISDIQYEWSDENCCTKERMGFSMNTWQLQQMKNSLLSLSSLLKLLFSHWVSCRTWNMMKRAFVIKWLSFSRRINSSLSLSLHHCRRLDLNSSISRWIHLCFPPRMSASTIERRAWLKWESCLSH